METKEIINWSPPAPGAILTNKQQASAAVESVVVANIREGIDWIANNTLHGGVENIIEGIDHEEIVTRARSKWWIWRTRMASGQAGAAANGATASEEKVLIELFKVEYLQSMVANLNSNLNSPQQKIDYIKEDNERHLDQKPWSKTFFDMDWNLHSN